MLGATKQTFFLFLCKVKGADANAHMCVYVCIFDLGYYWFTVVTAKTKRKKVKWILFSSSPSISQRMNDMLKRKNSQSAITSVPELQPLIFLQNFSVLYSAYFFYFSFFAFTSCPFSNAVSGDGSAKQVHDTRKHTECWCE